MKKNTKQTIAHEMQTFAQHLLITKATHRIFCLKYYYNFNLRKFMIALSLSLYY